MNFKKIGLGLVLFFVVVFTAQLPSVQASETSVCGDISSDTVWDTSGSPYIANCSLTIKPGATLTIKPGAVIQFTYGGSLIVDGNLVAEGTEEHPITFTNNGSNLWFGIKVNPAASARFDHVIIEKTGYFNYMNGTYSLSIYSDNVTVSCLFAKIYRISVIFAQVGMLVQEP